MKISGLRYFLGLCLALLVCLPGVASAKSQVINQVAAIVNNDVITQAELDRHVNLLKLRVKSAGEGKELPSDSVLRTQVLNQLINRSLQLQLAEENHIKVSSEQINQALTRVAQQNHISTRELYKRMEKNGFTVASFRKEIGQEILIQMVQGSFVASHISISQTEVNDVLKRIQSEKVEYNVGDILVALPATPSPAEVAAAREKAQALLKQLQAGASFKKIAMGHSNAQDALKGGDMGWRTLANMPSIFAERVVTMNPGEVAGPLRAANGFHLIKLLGMRNTQLPKSLKAREDDVKNMLFQQQFQDALATWLQQLRAEAYIKIM
ncbi:MAG: hypothetical protein COV52_07930 [Gammaproteobacteria bacterium CG11_big_fil_rev_8_21_14_0_20_46_22]|nr:MAG: hypothetical protein COW05_04010 [Gammaproteobacteria bacterium CG12_big_fil_rev_8_21_14_0_65_46_12]PIR10685.1 MAG: hypothetical protein COV52_07930 [Gammaproteobacteria bacterium CG11_big_fil_rev_8_21_14_0_20_46_22]